MTQIAVDGQIWNYTEIGGEHGRPQGSPLLVLHGWGRTGNEWISIAKELSEWSGRTAYVVDLPGFGGSNLPAQAGLPRVKDIFEYSDLVVELCKYLGLKKIIVIGHSLGGRVGIVLAAKHKEMVEKLVIIDGAGVKPKSIKRVILKAVAKLFAWVPEKIRRKVVTPFMDEDYRNSPARSAYSTAVAGGPALRDLYRAVVAQDLTKYLPEIECESVIVWGENDPILPLALVKTYQKYLAKHKIRVVWGAGHDPHLEKYDATLSILQESVE